MAGNVGLFSTTSAKAIKAGDFGYLNAILYMAPAELAGVGNLCPNASAGCRALCLGHYSGQASMVSDLERGDNSVRKSRRDKAQRFMRDRANFMADVVRSIETVCRRAAKQGLKPCIRMNGSTDIAWEGIKVKRYHSADTYSLCDNIFAAFPDVQFVDYTKNPRRFSRPLPSNYHLTFSRSEANESDARNILLAGHNVAVVFANALPTFWNGFAVVNGDEHDLRHLDPKAAKGSCGYVIGLSPKGAKAKRDTSGFVVR